MISYLAGKVLDIGKSSVIIEVNGVGYRVTLSDRIRNSLSKIGEPIKVFTYSVINLRDGVFNLYGFIKLEELRFFELLITVSGIGPRLAQTILDNIDLPTLQLAIIREDDSYLKKISGIGAKTAKRMILELKNKVLETDVREASQGRDLASEEEAVEALVSLGYSTLQAREVIREIPDNLKNTQDRLKEALKILGKNK
ncbi:MAG: Holliday junction branch migration protein RuvA [Candidatus Yanofskybacteria bacterium CG10_big_fil_rev_8_21_14_0_10_46_23]|uniref:Holliday junction branch migration complex subunit RuvA n=1 Tax=Candidatus Yanofskybacteria bacterium CG10_big_fil_rev_8_21_14_0_10_46_23 TaxID=1975098 RepID=A0A2H0R4G0_9BACT|nr:MAG: Holliday junction branch migration protein RuvA [Candidatus Yanofskybacteria bacterium CG10_big_fil_rev_8_21_14_0_10_46_23]